MEKSSKTSWLILDLITQYRRRIHRMNATNPTKVVNETDAKPTIIHVLSGNIMIFFVVISQIKCLCINFIL